MWKILKQIDHTSLYLRYVKENKPDFQYKISV